MRGCIRQILVCHFTLLAGYCFAQNPQSNGILDFDDFSRKIENTVQLQISNKDQARLAAINGQKVSLKAIDLTINSSPYKGLDIHSRGQTTLSFPRKSLSFDLDQGADFYHGKEKKHFKHFLMLSLAMDKYYLRNRLAFGMMQHLDLLEFFYSYANLEINGKSQGIYFLVERPQDWAIHDRKSPIVIRRGYNHAVEKAKTAKELSKDQAKTYLEDFKEIYKLIELQFGEQLYRSLSEKLDIEDYMEWMAFNFLVKNGDYADEVFFYIEPSTGLFRIIPWDYDDIFSAIPHEGKSPAGVREIAYVFSKEDRLDRKIAEDPYLYSKYLDVLRTVAEKLEDEVLEVIFEDTYAELFPYYSRPEILDNVKKDLYPAVDLEKLRTELASDFLMVKGLKALVPKK